MAVCSLPPCGGGLGRGVVVMAQSCIRQLLPPPPTPPHKGEGSTPYVSQLSRIQLTQRDRADSISTASALRGTPRRRRRALRPFLHLAEHAPRRQPEEDRQGEGSQPSRRRQQRENGTERGRGRRLRQQRRGHGAEQAERGLLAVEQVADGLTERAVDL